MKLLLTIILSLTSIVIIGQRSDLIVTITNVKNVEGHIEIGLYNNANVFPEVDKQFKVFYFKVTSNTIKYTIKDLAHGDYALAIFHDSNSDKVCNKNLLGIPTEDYGFSNNVRPFISPPSFEDANIIHNKQLSVKIQLD